MSLPDWDRAYGLPLYSAIIRSKPADFDVTEELGFESDGNGEHDYLYVEKTSTNTEWLARQLAATAELPAKDVGYSGLKDRHAITRQWFSVPRWNSPDWSSVDIEGVSILDVQRHSKKLRRGAHKTNHFKIVLRNLKKGSNRFSLEERLQLINERGVPNYFGEQRFGREGGNIALADQWAAGKRLPRHKRSLAISTVRSYMFNGVLDQRVRNGNWDQIVSGDLANLDGTGSVFVVDDIDADIARRCSEMDIHPAAELAGDGSECGHEAWQRALDKGRVKAGSRSLRLRVQDLHMENEKGAVRLSFTLGRGAFATSVLREIATTQTP